MGQQRSEEEFPWYTPLIYLIVDSIGVSGVLVFRMILMSGIREIDRPSNRQTSATWFCSYVDMAIDRPHRQLCFIHTHPKGHRHNGSKPMGLRLQAGLYDRNRGTVVEEHHGSLQSWGHSL